MNKINTVGICTLFLVISLIMITGSCDKDDKNDKTVIDDIDGNVYGAIRIGAQTWMTENLKTTKLSDGTDLPNVTDQSKWASLYTPAYCWYDNDIKNKDIYGALYNRFAANRYGLCPTGWHVPSSDEWHTLINNLGGVYVASGKLKEEDTTHWLSPNKCATDMIGFSALPGGSRGLESFFGMGEEGCWWTFTNYTSLRLTFDEDIVFFDESEPEMGYCIRCIKD
jgi:uncharacterized protein (TIGR02145 family)